MDSASLQTWASVEHLKMMVLQIIRVSIKTLLPGILIAFLMENVLFSLIFFLLKYSRFTILCQFQTYSKVIQFCIYIYFKLFSIIGYCKILNIVPCLLQHWRNVNWCSHYGKQYGSSLKKKQKKNTQKQSWHINQKSHSRIYIRRKL